MAAQYHAGGGPCLTAFDTGQAVQIPATTEDRRWPGFCRAAADHGIHSTFSVRPTVDGSIVGSLNLSAERPRAFDDAARETVEPFSGQAAIVLAIAQASWDGRELGENLGEEMSKSAVIEEAGSILMASSTHCGGRRESGRSGPWR